MSPRWCGIDWAETQHGVVIVDEQGKPAARARITDDPKGVSRLPGMLAVAADANGGVAVPAAIETPHSLLVASPSSPLVCHMNSNRGQVRR
ncbi:IS110 family transposase [Catelliglobosispora koreensis]|uniref:IS110 family transposase n=1 Tax=Catelliglobosispora koreensis TaxID=129052 RepID=UPI0003828A2C|nr:hypothetical protein [Catelliglobosispora koreensis]